MHTCWRAHFVGDVMSSWKALILDTGKNNPRHAQSGFVQEFSKVLLFFTLKYNLYKWQMFYVLPVWKWTCSNMLFVRNVTRKPVLDPEMALSLWSISPWVSGTVLGSRCLWPVPAYRLFWTFWGNIGSGCTEHSCIHYLFLWRYVRVCVNLNPNQDYPYCEGTNLNQSIHFK